MDVSQPQFSGPPCGTYGHCTFHKSLKFVKNGKHKTILLGEFFFVRISKKDDPCIGELKMLWSDKSNNQRLASVRLYFLPEQTPEGRLSAHGEDEVLAASDKVVLRLDDLVDWITDEVDWTHGLLATCEDDVVAPPDPFPLPVPEEKSDEATEEEKETGSPEQNTEEQLPLSEQQNKIETNAEDPLASSIKELTQPDEATPGSGPTSSPPESIGPKCEDGKQIVKDKEILQECVNKDDLKVLVLSYSMYCRYRAVIKRLEGVADKWLRHALVVAIGGFTLPGRNTHILFCRDTFDHEELSQHDLNCEYLAPILKARKQKKKNKNARSTSPGSESNTSEENKEITSKNDMNGHPNGFKQPPCKSEQEFLQKLFKFMKKRNTPIQRVPHLGFKQIDLFIFFSFAQKLGGYDKITGKKLWKHVYDELGGSPGSTSAATCTRRHYERLLLPFERYMDGRVYKPKQSRKSQNPQHIKMIKDENSNETIENEDTKFNGNVAVEDAYTFTDSNHENSNYSNLNEDGSSMCEEPPLSNDAYSDEDSKTIWSIQRKTDGNDDDEDKEESKQIKPLIIQKEQNESFSEKERKWNEIRKKNALARKWVRQLRPSRGSKSSGTEKTSNNNEDQNLLCQSESQPAMPCSGKQDAEDVYISSKHDQISTSMSSTGYQMQDSRDRHIKSPAKDANIGLYLPERCSSASGNINFTQSYAADRSSFPVKTQISTFSGDKNVKSHQIKTESLFSEKSWHGYMKGSVQNQKIVHDVPGAYSSNLGASPYFLKHETKTASYENASHELMQQGISQVSSDSSVFGNVVKTESPETDDKPKISQRRPSVIQHTESITSPSPSQSPKQTGSETFSDVINKCGVQGLPSFSPNPKVNTFPNQYSNHLLHNMVGKVSEWLTKGVPEAVACKTPSSVPEKVELHDKVLMPSSSKTPGPGTGKVPMYVNKNKSDPNCYSSPPKTVREKLSLAHRHKTGDINKLAANLPINNVRNNSVHQKMYLPVNNTHLNSGLINSRNISKFEPAFNLSGRNAQFCDPTYSQPKRHKSNHTSLAAPAAPPRPSMLPFVRQQMYRTSPHSDIPKTAPSSCNDYENVILDLSVKKRPHPSHESSKPSTSSSTVCNVSPVEDGVCLDLTVKKKPNTSNDNGIENITPPLPSSPKPSFHPSQSSSVKSFSTLLTLQELARDDIKKQSLAFNNRPMSVGYNPQLTLPVSPLVMPSTGAAYSGSSHAKFPPDLFSSLSDPAYTKEMAKHLYMSPDSHNPFPQYVIPSFYSSWTPTTTSSTVNQSNNIETSPNVVKGVTNHGVFPKHYMYKQQFHPVLCKDNGQYPSKTK